ncbi:hypothetical protein OAH12_01040 [Cyclobacteriaceae bacterium]|nr:hypothetical protein [Cyclobacteriaceae bacterium]
MRLSYVIDESSSETVENIQHLMFSEENITSCLYLGFHNKPIWVKVEYNAVEEGDYRLRIAKPLFDHLSFYFKNDTGWSVQDAGLKETPNGTSASGYYFPVHVSQGKNVFFIRGKSRFSQIYDISIHTSSSEKRLDELKNIANGIVIGLFFIMVVFNLFLSFGLKDSVYRFYSGHAFFTMMVMLALQGFWNQSLLHLDSDTSSALIGVSLNCVGVAAILFWIKFLELKKSSPIMFKILVGFCIADVPTTFVLTGFHYSGSEVTYAPRAAMNAVFCVFGLIAGISAYRNGYRAARFFVFGWFIYFTGVVSISLILFGVIPNNEWTKNYSFFAITTEVIFMAFALADRYNVLREEKTALDQTLQTKSNDLEIVTLDNKMKQQYKENLAIKLQGVIDSPGNNEKVLRGIIQDLRFQNQVDEKQLIFQQNIDEVDTSFAKKIKEVHPTLSFSEIEICGLIKLNYVIKDIAGFRSTSEGAVKVAKTRIKKKIGVSGKLDDYISSL